MRQYLSRRRGTLIGLDRYDFYYLDLALPASLTSCADILARLSRHDSFPVLSKILTVDDLETEQNLSRHRVTAIGGSETNRPTKAELRGGGAITQCRFSPPRGQDLNGRSAHSGMNMVSQDWDALW